MPPHYITVYQVSADQAFATPADLVHFVPAVFGLTFLIFGIRLYLGKTSRMYKPLRLFVATCLSGLSVLFLCVITPRIFLENYAAFHACESGNCKLAEGLVADFDPMPYEGHKDECFSVQTNRFCYSDYMASPGFRNTASHGGPIHEGLPVRVAFIPTRQGNLILKLEIAK
ncbi:MAG TPA: hypothetical protein VIM62_13015 [Acidobacteriaceae bacterium]